MKIPAPKNYEITLEQTVEKAPAWFVRVYRKRFLFKRLVSSDWFLDPEQAKQFAEQLANDLNGESGLQNLKDRKPGWVLHRPLH
jgi:hypothetical protein